MPDSTDSTKFVNTGNSETYLIYFKYMYEVSNYYD